MGNKIYRQLQVLRAIAASFVVIDHSISAVWPDSQRLKYVAWCFGDIGVGVFFVISGFIMVHVSENDFGVPKSGAWFALRRIKRVIPLYWITTALAALRSIFLGGHGVYVDTIIKSLLFIPFINIDGLYRPVHGVGWTLNYEMFFYLCFSLSLFIPNKVTAICLCGAFFSTLVGLGALFEGSNWEDDPTSLFAFYSYPITLLFVAGMFLRLLANVVSYQGNFDYSSIIMSILLIFIVAIFAFFIKTYPVSVIWRVFVWIVCTLVVAGSLFLGNGAKSTTPFPKFLEFLGNASYSTYLFHPFALMLIKVINSLAHISGWGMFLFCLISAHVMGILAHQYVERPILRLFADRQRALIPGRVESV